MSDDKLEARVKELLFDNGKGAQLGIEDLSAMQPGLARLMPEIGARVWKCYHAAKAKNWPLARFQCKEARKLMEMGAVTRPKYEENMGKFINEQWNPLLQAIEDGNLEQFEKLFAESVEQANAYHELYDKPYIRWKVPAEPPQDLDLTPRGG